METRVGVVVKAKGLAEHHEFPGLKAFGRIEATRVIDGKTETDVRVFALSRKLSADDLLSTARAHAVRSTSPASTRARNRSLES